MTTLTFYNGLREIGGTFVVVETDEARCMFDFGFAETYVLGNVLFRFAIYTQSNQQSIQIWFLRTP